MDSSAVRKETLGSQAERQERRENILNTKIECAEAKSNAHFVASSQHSARFAGGQPILIGHHSENSAKKAQQRTWSSMDKCVEESKKASILKGILGGVGKGGISSTDSDAIEKLEVKLAGLIMKQETMKAINKIMRNKKASRKDQEAIVCKHLGFTNKNVHAWFDAISGRNGSIYTYEMTNNNANINQTRKRIEELKKLHNSMTIEDKGNVDGIDWDVSEDDGRVIFNFLGKPCEEIRTILKSNGFKWSPYAEAWVRKITTNAINATKRIIEELNATLKT